MSEITLVAETGRATGTRPSKRLRADGEDPGVVYGQGIRPVAVAVDRRELRHALSGPAGLNAVINLDGRVGDRTPTVVKAIQRHPVRAVVTHVDFLVVNLNEEITVDVPIILEGEAKAVLSEGGLVEQPPHACWPSPRRPATSRTSSSSTSATSRSATPCASADIALPGRRQHRASTLTPSWSPPQRHPRRGGRGGAEGEGEEGEGAEAEGEGADAEGGDSSE